MGARLRMKATRDISGFPAPMQKIFRAMQRYGLIVADNGSNWYFQGGTDPRWDDDDLGQLKDIPGSAFDPTTHVSRRVDAATTEVDTRRQRFRR